MAKESELGTAVYWKILQKLLQEKTSVPPDLQGIVTVTSKKENTSLTDLALFHVSAAEDAPQTVSQT